MHTQCIPEQLKKAKKRFWMTGRAARCYQDFRYRTLNIWNRTCRVVAKILANLRNHYMPLRI